VTIETPTESKRWQIIENIVSELRDIRRANGFFSDVSRDSVTTDLKDLETILDQELPYLQITIPDETDNTVLMPQKDEGDLVFFIEGAVGQTQDDAPLGQILERTIRDVRKKILEDKSRGGIAKSSRVIRVESDSGEHGYEGNRLFRITLLVKYKFPWTDP
jgi:hypothetical protein